MDDAVRSTGVRYSLRAADLFDKPSQFQSVKGTFWGLVCTFFGGMTLGILFGVVGWKGMTATLVLRGMVLLLIIVLAGGLASLLLYRRRPVLNPSDLVIDPVGLILEWENGERRSYSWSRKSSLTIVERGPGFGRIPQSSLVAERTAAWALREGRSHEWPLTEEAARAVILEAGKHRRDAERRIWIKLDLPPSFDPKPDENVLMWEYRIGSPEGSE